MLIRLQRGLFTGDFPLSQTFGNVLIWNGVDVYAQWGLLGHNGLDYALPTGTPLFSCVEGTVLECRYDANGYGYYILIENEYCGVLYAHMKKLSDYKVGMKIPAGAFLGLSGNTGNSTGPHLHFAVFPKPRDRKNGYNGYIDPLDKNLVEWVDSLISIVGSQELEKAQEALIAATASRDAWQDSSETFEKANIRLKKANEIQLNQLIALKAELVRFNKDVFIFRLGGKEISILLRPVKEVPSVDEMLTKGVK